MAGRIEPSGFYAASGVLFAIAIIAAISRIIARLRRFRRLYLDDVPFFLAILTLIAGTILTYINVPLAYSQELVQLGISPPPADFLALLIQDEKTQYAATTLIGATIIAVKLSFLTFFHMIIRRAVRWYLLYWAFVLTVTAASAPVLMFSDFIACPYTGVEIMTECVTDAARSRQNAVVRASVALDIITDVLIISIPVVILWNVQMSVRRKLVLAMSLCMGIFMIVCAGVRIGAANVDGGFIDVLWVLLWQQLEACVAVIVVSVTAFRILFTSAEESTADESARAVRGRAVQTGDLEEGRGAHAWSNSKRWGVTKEERKDASRMSEVEQRPNVVGHETRLIESRERLKAPATEEPTI